MWSIAPSMRFSRGCFTFSSRSSRSSSATSLSSSDWRASTSWAVTICSGDQDPPPPAAPRQPVPWLRCRRRWSPGLPPSLDAADGSLRLPRRCSLSVLRSSSLTRRWRFACWATTRGWTVQTRYMTSPGFVFSRAPVVCCHWSVTLRTLVCTALEGRASGVHCVM